MQSIRHLPFLILPFLLAACSELTPPGHDDKTLAQIEYTVMDVFNGRSRSMAISANGEVVIVETQHENSRRIVSEITPEERDALIASFKGWNKLDQKKIAVDMSPQISITYGKYDTITTSRLDLVPEPFTRAKSALDKIAIELSRAADAKTAPATATSTAPSTAPGN
jgi:hypothetical protein